MPQIHPHSYAKTRKKVDDLGRSSRIRRPLSSRHPQLLIIAPIYLRKMGIPNSIIEKMNSTNPNDMQWLSEDEVKSLSGYIPEYQDWLDAKCAFGTMVPDDPMPCKECSANELLERWTSRAQKQNFDCKSGLLEKAQFTARQEILDEYVKNGRLKEMVEEHKRECAALTANNRKNRRDCR